MSEKDTELYPNVNYSDCNFIFKTVQSNTIKTLFEALKDNLTDVNFRINKRGIQILSVDPNQIAITHLKLVSDNFEFYKCEYNNLTIGVNIKSLYTLLKTVGTNDVITMFIVNKNKNRLEIMIENKEKGIRDISKLKLLDFDEDEYEIPDLKFDSVIRMPSNDFQKICKDLSNIAEVVKIESSGENFSMSVDGDIGEKEINIKENANVEVIKKTDNSVSEQYPLKYLLQFIKSTNLCSTVELFTKIKHPLVIIYSVGSLGSLKFVLSPFVNDL